MEMNKRNRLSEQEIKKVELDALLYIRKICQQYHLRYYLAWGTLLGAVRHKGFIPWDDDIDIMMPRSDYERLLELVPSLRHSYYKILSNPKNEDYYYTHAKMIDTRTLCVENDLQTIQNMGIWVDIFPLDGMPDKFKIHYFKMRVLHRMRALSAHPKMPETSFMMTPIIYLAWKIVRIFGFQFFVNRMERLARKYAYESSNYVSNVVEPEARICIYRKEVFDSSLLLSFEKESFEVPILYQEYLKNTYGDYMQLPPVEKRIGHSFEAYWKI